MIAPLAAASSAPSHVRPFNPHRDLEDLATLIETAFGRELARGGSRMVQDMRQIARWGPMLRLAQTVMPLFTGYVWIGEDRLVGNASLSHGEERDVWNLSNVAVLPDFRGRGIAGCLTDAAIAHVQRSRGKRILLQVRSDNESALALYRHRGFVTFDTMHELDLLSVSWPALVGPMKPGLRRVRASDWRKVYAVATESTPRETLKRRPLKPRRFRRGPRWQVGECFKLALSAEARFELVAEQNEEIAAYGGVTAHLWHGSYELELHVVPSQRGGWERDLVEGLFHSMRRIPHNTVRAYVSTSHREAVDALHQLGFETLRILDQMSLELG